MKHVIVGTAGHIDHGKSALVRALTGIDPDRLEEEKRRGITIDLGFAHFDLGEDLRLGFVDVPGHERFVKNMLAGASGIDLVLLVVAADESIKPQTREHFDICKLLGVPRGLVVITKSDLVDPEIVELVRMEIQEFVAGSFLEGAPIVAASSRTGDGMHTLKAELYCLGLRIAARPTELPFRLPIDRVFMMRGFGVVVTGTLIAGKIGKEEEVEIHPIGRRARVRGLEVHNRPAEVAVAGQRTALNLAGVEAQEIRRGMVLAPPALFEPTDRLDGVLQSVPSAPPLKHRAKVHFHCGTSESVAEVVLLEAKELRPGARAYAQLRVAEKGLVLPGDRFIIRQFSPVTTIGGGVVLDNRPSRHRLADPAVHAFLAALEQGGPEERLQLLVEQAGEVSPGAVAARIGWQPSEVVRIARLGEAKKRLVILGQQTSVLTSAAHFQALSQRVVKELEAFHQANPLVAGLAREDLRGRLATREQGEQRLPSPTLFNAALQALVAENKIEVQGEAVRRLGREIRLSPEELSAKEQISRAFERAGLAVPAAKEVLDSLRIDRARAEKILHLLLKEKVLLKVSEDLIFHHSALEELRGLLARRKTQTNRIDVAAFKELTGLSRKYAIPLLEYLDRERVTRREGDVRIIL
jgi:selenocysteine-specific elongation factor